MFMKFASLHVGFAGSRIPPSTIIVASRSYSLGFSLHPTTSFYISIILLKVLLDRFPPWDNTTLVS